MHQVIQVYAVVRIDIDEGIDLSDPAGASDRIRVKEVLPTLEEATREVQRLNELNGSRRAFYFWQATRYYPEGRSTPGTE